MKILMVRRMALMTALLALFVLSTLTTVYAQNDAPPGAGYYLAADADGVQQVYQLVLAADADPRQITYAESDVLTFGAATDGLSVAYVSDGQLWLQPLHTETAEPLAEITSTDFLAPPVYSPDGQHLAYVDNGVWLLDLGTRETRPLVENVRLNPDRRNMGEMRIYQPERFVMSEDGAASHLIVYVGMWEWAGSGVYDLAAGTLVELEGRDFNKLLPLSDGRVLVYGNNMIDGLPALHIANSFDDINAPNLLVSFDALGDAPLFASQAVEMPSGNVRVYGMTFGESADDYAVFTFDYDLNTSASSSVRPVTIATRNESDYTTTGWLSPDGGFIPATLNAEMTDYGVYYGTLRVVNLETGEPVALNLPENAALFQWQGN